MEINNWRGIKNPQIKIYIDCYKKNYEKFEWLIFNDIDEYIYLKGYNNRIKDFLNKSKFKKCENIQLNWLLFTDNNLMYYHNASLKLRFTEKDPKLKSRKISKYSNGKSILRGHIPNIKIKSVHCISNELKICDGFGIERKTLKPDYKYFYFKHYYCKSTEEFIEKLNKGDVHFITKNQKVKFYFGYNKITYEKINYIEKKTGINLTNYKKKERVVKKHKNKNIYLILQILYSIISQSSFIFYKIIYYKQIYYLNFKKYNCKTYKTVYFREKDKELLKY